jgi:catechol 2,3-dioxygenase-like lactoylglutathione lyase family enzyme
MASNSLRLCHFALIVREYDEAIAFYVEKLGFTLVEDTDLGDGKRWVRVSPGANGSAELLLARAVNDEQAARIGNQSGGRVFLFFETNDFEHDFALFTARGVRMVRPPKDEPYGRVAVFADLYGNLFDLIEPTGLSALGEAPAVP